MDKNGENCMFPRSLGDVRGPGFHFQFIAVSLTVYWVEPTQYGFRVGTNSPPGVGLTPSAKGELHHHNTPLACYGLWRTITFWINSLEAV